MIGQCDVHPTFFSCLKMAERVPIVQEAAITESLKVERVENNTSPSEDIRDIEEKENAPDGGESNVSNKRRMDNGSDFMTSKPRVSRLEKSLLEGKPRTIMDMETLQPVSKKSRVDTGSHGEFMSSGPRASRLALSLESQKHLFRSPEGKLMKPKATIVSQPTTGANSFMAGKPKPSRLERSLKEGKQLSEDMQARERVKPTAELSGGAADTFMAAKPKLSRLERSLVEAKRDEQAASAKRDETAVEGSVTVAGGDIGGEGFMASKPKLSRLERSLKEQEIPVARPHQEQPGGGGGGGGEACGCSPELYGWEAEAVPSGKIACGGQKVI